MTLEIDIEKRIEWLDVRLGLSDIEKGYITLQIKDSIIEALEISEKSGLIQNTDEILLVPDIRNKLSPIVNLIKMMELDNPNLQGLIEKEKNVAKNAINYLAKRDVYENLEGNTIEISELLPDHYTEVKEPSYQGQGVHNVLELERIAEDYREQVHQLRIREQSILRKFNIELK